MRDQKTQVAVVVSVLVLLLLVAGGVFLALASRGNASGESQATTGPSRKSGTGWAALPTRKIRIGYVLSQATAKDPTGGANGWGYTSLTRIFKEGGLEDQRFVLVPVVEPGTGDDPDIKTVCDQLFGGTKPVEFTNADAMRDIDVFIVCCVWNTTPELTAFLHRAVSQDGKGLLVRTGLGIYEIMRSPEAQTTLPPTTRPSDSPPSQMTMLLDLNGVRSGHYVYSGRKVPFLVLERHPILGNEFGIEGMTLRLEPNGIFGDTLGTSLMQSPDSPTIPPLDAAPAGEPIEPNLQMLRLSQLGKGKLVILPFYGFQRSTPETREFVRIVHVRSVKWLVGEFGDASN